MHARVLMTAGRGCHAIDWGARRSPVQETLPVPDAHPQMQCGTACKGVIFMSGIHVTTIDVPDRAGAQQWRGGSRAMLWPTYRVCPISKGSCCSIL
jgi:hypothetical protein